MQYQHVDSAPPKLAIESQYCFILFGISSLIYLYHLLSFFALYGTMYRITGLITGLIKSRTGWLTQSISC